MSRSLKNQRRQWLIGLAALICAVYYAAVFRPLTRRTEALDRPLADLARERVASNQQPATAGCNLAQLTENLRRAQSSAAALEKVRRQISARVELEPDIRTRLRDPFQLVDFQNERQNRIEQLGRLAKQLQVSLEPRVFAGFPEHHAELQPAMLWPQLAITCHLLATAIQCKVGTVRSLALLPLAANPSAGDTNGLAAIPVRIELIGSMTAISRFLLSLPLRAGEIQGQGLPEIVPAKPALFIDHLIARKQSPEKPDDVLLDLQVSGFVSRESKGAP